MITTGNVAIRLILLVVMTEINDNDNNQTFYTNEQAVYISFMLYMYWWRGSYFVIDITSRSIYVRNTYSVAI